MNNLELLEKDLEKHSAQDVTAHPEWDEIQKKLGIDMMCGFEPADDQLCFLNLREWGEKETMIQVLQYMLTSSGTIKVLFLKSQKGAFESPQYYSYRPLKGASNNTGENSSLLKNTKIMNSQF